MPAIFTELPQQVGDYTLHTLLGTQYDRDFYAAHQNHVEREVIVEIIDAATTSISSEYFVEATRARVSALIPKVMPVYEASQVGNYWLVSQERPKVGRPLTELIAQRESLSILSLCRLLEQVCNLYLYCLAHKIHTTVLTANSIYMIEEDQFCFLSPVRAPIGDKVSRATKMAYLADAIIPLIPHDVPGRTRFRTVVSWLQVGFEGQILTWGSIASTASLIIEQLYPELAIDLISESNRELLHRHRSKRFYQSHFFAGAIALAFGVTLALVSALVEPKSYDSEEFSEFVINEKTIIVQSRPVSVQEYRQFLIKLSRMSETELAKLHKGTPLTNYNHKPSNWSKQIQALQDKDASPSPVHSVSYWDALIYAKVNKAQIPTTAQLQHIKQETDNNQFAEWTKDSQDLPLYQKSYIIINAEGDIERITDPKQCSPNTTFRIIKSIKRQNS